MEGMNAKKPLHPEGSRAIKIGGCIVGYVSGKKKTFRDWALPRQRLIEVEAIIRSRHGAFVDTDDAGSYLTDLARAAANARRGEISPGGHVLAGNVLAEAVFGYCRKWLPGLPADEIEAEAWDAVDGRYFDKADEVAKRLGVTFAERMALGLKTIGCRDLTKRERAKATKAAKVEKRRAQRRAAGVKPREEYEAQSVASLAASWGVSRKTIYAWRKAGNPKGYMSDANICDSILGSHMLPSAKGQRSTKAASGPKSRSLPRFKRVAPKAQEKKKPADRSTAIHRHNNFHDQVITKIRGFSEALNSAPSAIRLVVSNAAMVSAHMSERAALERGQNVSRRASA